MFVYQGTIAVPDGSTPKNNANTAEPFSLPAGPVMLQSDQACFVAQGSSSDLEASDTTGIYLEPFVLFKTSTDNANRIIAARTVTGDANLRVYAITGNPLEH